MDAVEQNLTEKLPPHPVPQPRLASEELRPLAVGQHRDRADQTTVALTIGGGIDSATAAPLAEMLHSRLRRHLTRLVLDLSDVGFLGVAGISVLIQADLQAQYAGTELVIVPGNNRQAARALTVTAQHHHLRLHSGPVTAAVHGSDS